MIFPIHSSQSVPSNLAAPERRTSSARQADSQEIKNKEISKQRRIEAQERMKLKKKAGRAERLSEQYGSDIDTDYKRKALINGFMTSEGKPDLAAFTRRLVDQKVRNFTDEKGQHPFVKEDGTVDTAAYNKHLADQRARNYTNE